MNSHGVADEELILCVSEGHIDAINLINWVRDFNRRLPMIKAQLAEFTHADKFCIQMIKNNFHNACGGGTHTTLPEDVCRFIDFVKTIGK